ncbi:unnamed protein product [Auanema sp. JU1783]|nr:unnamed protein product [Auanema sp. JU1783]
MNEALEIGRLMCKPPAPSNFTLPDDLRDKLYCQAFKIVVPLHVAVFVNTAFLLLIFMAAAGNAAVMWIIARHKTMRNGFNFFLFNMAFADLMIAVLNVGTSWTFNLYYDWWYGSLCTPTSFFGIAPTSVSVFSMMALSWDRMKAVIHPLPNSTFSRKQAIIVISIIWIVSTLTALPNTIFATVKEFWFYNPRFDSIEITHSCTSELDHNHNKVINYILFVTQYAVPLTVIVYIFGRIYYELYISAEAALKECKGASANRAKAVKMLAVMVGAFGFSWLPYHMYHTFELSEYFPQSDDTSEYTYLAIYWIAMSTTVYNPIIYCLVNERFRLGFRYVFRWLPFVHCSRGEYEYSQLFPERMRSMEISLQLSGRQGRRVSSNCQYLTASQKAYLSKVPMNYQHIDYQRSRKTYRNDL